jgi:hypothetical protein
MPYRIVMRRTICIVLRVKGKIEGDVKTTTKENK